VTFIASFPGLFYHRPQAIGNGTIGTSAAGGMLAGTLIRGFSIPGVNGLCDGNEYKYEFIKDDDE
jgi:hypothetical protein